MKAVVDTNVFVSSFFGGKPREIIELWKSGLIVLCVSPEIFEEYFAVLRRMNLPDCELRELMSLLGQQSNLLFTSKTPKLSVVESDPDDDKFIQCAVALNCDCIITGDRALKNIRNYGGIRICSPSEFLRTNPRAANATNEPTPTGSNMNGAQPGTPE